MCVFFCKSKVKYFPEINRPALSRKLTCIKVDVILVLKQMGNSPPAVRVITCKYIVTERDYTI